ncbi:MAG: hypothetical protein AAB767_03995 [Patescibacteria group bacterium]|mgnify:CR=1 FL=1
MSPLYKKYTTVVWRPLFLLATPLIALAGDTPLVEITDPPADATDLVNRISTFILNPVIYVLFAAAFVVFIWGLVQFVANLDNEEARSTGGKHMLWGIIGMAIMAGVTGIVIIIQNTITQIGG